MAKWGAVTREYPNYNHQNNYDMMMEARHYKPLYEHCVGKVVMDIGANTGAVSYIALNNFASKIIAIEAAPDTYEHLINQPFVISDGGRVIETINYAVVGDDFEGDHIKINCNRAYTQCYSVLGKARNPDRIFEVPVIKFYELLGRYKPNILFVDIEGAESFIDFSKIPDYVEGIGIEIHQHIFKDIEKRNAIYNSLIKSFPKILKYKGRADFLEELICVR